MEFLKWLIFKPTLISIVGVIAIIVSIPLICYCFSFDGGASLGAIYPMLAIVILIPIIAVDRYIVKRISPLTLSIFELGLIFLLYTALMFENRITIVNINDSHQEYLIIRYDNFSSIKDFSKDGMFNKQAFVTKDSFIHLNKDEFDKKRIKIQIPKKWEGYSCHPITDKNGIEYEIYTNCNRTYEKQEIFVDSILKIHFIVKTSN